MQQQKQNPKATLRLLFSEKALVQQLSAQEPEASMLLLNEVLKRSFVVPKMKVFFSCLTGLMIWPLSLFLMPEYDDRVFYWQPLVLFVYGAYSLVILILSTVGLIKAKSHRLEWVLGKIREEQMIARVRWPQALPALLALMGQTGSVYDKELLLWWWAEAYSILIRWLPRLQHGELGHDECRTLRKLLSLNQQYEDVQVAILLALGTARDEKARRVATRLFRHSPYERVREAARDCLLELGAPVSRRLERRD